MHSINGSWSSLTWLMEKERKQTRSGNKNSITNSKKKKRSEEGREGKKGYFKNQWQKTSYGFIFKLAKFSLFGNKALLKETPDTAEIIRYLHPSDLFNTKTTWGFPGGTKLLTSHELYQVCIPSTDCKTKNLSSISRCPTHYCD